MQLRKICQRPYLFESVEDKINPTGLIDDNIYRVAGKFELLTRILRKFFATGHRELRKDRKLWEHLTDPLEHQVLIFFR